LAESSLISDFAWLLAFILVWAFPCSYSRVVGTISELQLESAVFPQDLQASQQAVCYFKLEYVPNLSPLISGYWQLQVFSLNCWYCWYGCDTFSFVLNCRASFLCLYKPRSVH